MLAGIAYRLHLPEPDRLPDLVQHARLAAELRGWSSAPAPNRSLSIRVRHLDGTTETTPRRVDLSGLWLNPHFAGDDVCLVFDRHTGDLIDASRTADDVPNPMVHDFAVTRTTFTDGGTHAAIVGFLEELAERDLASVEMGSPDGRELARDPQQAKPVLAQALRYALLAPLARPDQPFRLGGAIEFMAADDARERNAKPPDAIALLEPGEGASLVRMAEQLVSRWGESTPGLDGTPEQRLRALETLTDQLLSHPTHRRDSSYLQNEFALESGTFLGFALIDALGGFWERAGSAGASHLRVANLGGGGLTWRPMRSQIDRLHSGPMYAPDTVFQWLRTLAETAREALAQAAADQ